MSATLLGARWRALATREKSLVAGAAALVGFALLWWIVLGPALTTLRSADRQHREFDAQLAHMVALQTQARTLQNLPQQSHEEALRLLETSVRQRLGLAARMTIAGERVTLTLAGVAPDALAQWLNQARVTARAVPSDARLARNAGGSWDGTLVLTLPPR